YGNFHSIFLSNDFKVVPINTLNSKRGKYSSKYVKLFLTQVIISIYIFYKETGLIHNDLRPENVLVFSNNDIISFIIKVSKILNKYKFIFNEKFIFKINDYDFSKTNNIANKMIENSTLNPINNIFGDLHYLFITLFSTSEYIKKFKNLYTEYYHYIIENRCEECDKYFKRKVKNNVNIEHISENKISFDVVESFISNSFIFEEWRNKI